MLNGITPFFIVDDLQPTIGFYCSRMGFKPMYSGGDGIGPDFRAFVGRENVMLNFKYIAPDVHPQPNRLRNEAARWDSYVFTSDPDTLYEEFLSRDVPMHKHLADTNDGLRAFEITDNNGYVLCFGRPLEV